MSCRTCRKSWTRHSGCWVSETDPFAVLGLTARAEVTDDDVRAAWRRIAAATHPDRDEGGSPERYAEAAAAYAALRTAYGRGEALADLAERARSPRSRRFAAALPGWRVPVRILAAVAVCALASGAAGWSPGTLALLAGAATWLALSLRRQRS